jgi:O-succinylbenzoic acid--CoA ligase
VPAAPSPRLRALDLPPGEEFAAALAAAWDAGDAVLPVDPRLPPPARAALDAALRPGDPVEPGTALCIATSGSTGRPKGVLLSHAALAASADATMQRLGATADDVWLSCLPWHHIGGLQVLLRSRRLGVPLVVHAGFDVDAFAATPATLTALVPTQLHRLLDAGVDLTRFRAILLGGAAAPTTLLDRARAAGARVVTTYGMSETAGGCVYDGVPLDGVEVRVEPDGRILLGGPVLMSGYRMRPDETAAALRDGWLRTEDVGTWDGRRLTVHGRRDDIVVTGGENVVAGDVADVLSRHPAVVDVAVTGVPDIEWGQCVVAVVAATDPPPTLAELRELVAKVMPAAAAPRSLVLVDEIPRLSSGKPDRRAIATLARG